MNRRLFLAASVGAIALLGCEGDGKPGTSPGKSVSTFNPLNVTGDDAGEKRCQIWKNGGSPVAIVFARELTPALTGLVKKVDDATVLHRSSKMGSFVVMLSDDDKLEGKLKELAEKEKLQKIVLTIDNPSGPPGYDIQKESEVTVILYVKRKIVKTFAFAKDKLTEKDVASIIDALPEILPAK